MKKHFYCLAIFVLVILIPLLIFSQNSNIYKVIESKCLGCKICFDECPVDAISMQNGKAVIDAEKCIGCGICEKACRFDAIVVEIDEEKIAEKDTIKTTQTPDSTKKEDPIRIFRVSEEKCIGCKICQQKCPVDAIEMIEGKAAIDVEKCILCGACEAVCPVEAIQDTMVNPDSLPGAE